MWGYQSPPYRVGLYAPLGYSILTQKCNLTRFKHQERYPIDFGIEPEPDISQKPKAAAKASMGPLLCYLVPLFG